MFNTYQCTKKRESEIFKSNVHFYNDLFIFTNKSCNNLYIAVNRKMKCMQVSKNLSCKSVGKSNFLGTACTECCCQNLGLEIYLLHEPTSLKRNK